MKFQTKHIAKFIVIAALSLSAVAIVAAEEPSTSTSTSTSTSSTSPTSPIISEPTAVPVEPVVAPVNYEENVSFNDTDLGVALFKSTDANGNPSMDFYRLVTGSTTSNFLFSVTQADVAPYLTNHPAVNTLVASVDGVSVYVLTTGEIQVNAGPDAEGKIHVKIFNGIPWTQVYGYTIDPVK